MRKFLHQLRQREVLRTAGLYIGVCWILIQGADIVLPAFGIPDWVFRALIYIAVVGFPIIVILAWYLDVSEEGITLDDGGPEAVVLRFGERKLDFVVIALLVIALALSLYFNVVREQGAEKAEQSTAIIISVFDNRTDDELLDELIEARLAMLLERAPQVFTIEQRFSSRHGPGEGVLAGFIERDGSSLNINLSGRDPTDDADLFKKTFEASGEADVLPALESMAGWILSELGELPESIAGEASEDFTASLAAAEDWARGRKFERQGDSQAAAEAYKRAIEIDRVFPHALVSLALLHYRLGDEAAGRATWGLAQRTLDRLNDRERLKALGVYRLEVEGDAAAALTTFYELLEKYPAEVAIRSQVARAAFQQADFETALAESDRVLQVYTEDRSEGLRTSRYARYAGDLERAIAEAEAVLKIDPQDGEALFQLALAHAATGQIAEARGAYNQIKDAGPFAAEAALGLLDLDVYQGRFARTVEYLPGRISHFAQEQQHRMAALNSLVLADAFLFEGDAAAAASAAQHAIELWSDDRARIPAALILVESGKYGEALGIAEKLQTSSRNTDRAYGLAISAAQLRRERRYIEAIELLGEALEIADLWRLHFELGRVYAKAEMFAEAFVELGACKKLHGQAAAMFLDDMPTIRGASECHYWFGVVSDALGMSAAAAESYRDFIALRPEGGAHADDAAMGLSRLEGR